MQRYCTYNRKKMKNILHKSWFYSLIQPRWWIKKNHTKQGKRKFQKCICFDLKSQEEQLSHMLKATDLTCSMCSLGPFVTWTQPPSMCLKCLVSLLIFISFYVLSSHIKSSKLRWKQPTSVVYHLWELTRKVCYEASAVTAQRFEAHMQQLPPRGSFRSIWKAKIPE